MKKWPLLLCFLLFISPLTFSEELIKTPNVSGKFYSANPDTLSKDIDAFLKSASVEPSQQKISMLIVPHAGYVYSGGVAAHGYKAASLGEYKTIVVIGPSHFYNMDGVSIWKEGFFETPLGRLEVDRDFAEKLLSANERFYFEPKAFDREHSVEVQLPFLQKTFKDFKIVPILTSARRSEDAQALAAALNEAVGTRDDVLVVISTDMSHYFDSQTAKTMDADTLASISRFEYRELWNSNLNREKEMCGFPGVVTGLLYAQLKGFKNIKVLKYAHSGDVTGDLSSVVGYSAISFSTPEENKGGETMSAGASALSSQQKKELLTLARETITTYINENKTKDFPKDDPRFLIKEGAFVTLHKKGELRGCIGHITADVPLAQMVRDMAIASATADPRFPKVSSKEIGELEIEISVLTVPRRTTDVNEIQPGVHGVIVRRGANQGVFLPQVATEYGWTREKLLSTLCAHKAGLPPDAWKDSKTIIEIFTADVFSEKEFSSK